MVPVLIQVVLLGVAAAMAPLPVIVAIALLDTGRPIANSAAYLVGGLLVYVVVALAGGAIIVLVEDSLGFRRHVSTAGYVVITVVGAFFLVVALITWRSKRQIAIPARANQALASLVPYQAFVLGLLLCSPGLKNTILTVAALSAIAAHGLGTLQATLAMCLFVVVTLVPPTAPIVTYLALPRDRAENLTTSWGAWVEDHAASIIVIASTAIGVFLIQEGLSGVLS